MSSPREDVEQGGVPASVLVPAVVTPVVIIIIIVVMVIVYLNCYRGNNIHCDVRITLPWNRTNVVSEQLGDNVVDRDPDVNATVPEAPKGSKGPGFDNPIYDTPVSASYHYQPSTSLEPDAERHDAENQYATMSQIKLT